MIHHDQLYRHNFICFAFIYYLTCFTFMLLFLDYYTQNMLGLQMDQEVLGELIRLKVPTVWKVLNQHNVMWTLVVSRWFICLYIDILPVEVRTTQGYQYLVKLNQCLLSLSGCQSYDVTTVIILCELSIEINNRQWHFQTVLRIWDCLFYEGSKILFRVALTLIHHHQNLISQAQSLPEICERFKQITHGEFVEDCHSFMQVNSVACFDTEALIILLKLCLN